MQHQNKDNINFSESKSYKIVWDPTVKPRGMLGGHLNVINLFQKCDDIRILLLGSNIDYFCISETCIGETRPSQEALATIGVFICWTGQKKRQRTLN